MGIKIYNTLTRKKEDFVTLEPNKVRMYVCGVTVYNKAHVGHAMSALVFDVIRRYLTYRGYEVLHVTNFTDVDDKIINRANLLNIDPFQLAEGYIEEFQQQLKALNILPATVNPRATREMDTIIKMIQGLVDKGCAYVADGDVYFRVQKDPHYGKLSGRRVEDMKAGARIEVGELKDDPLDFALWKAAKPGEPAWDSPWGKGRPGWHIECSAMNLTHLGEQIDIHGGGNDLIFPHHENEIAQSEAATGKPFVRYWVHNGFVNIEHEKMSKSLGNILAIRDLLREYHPEALRLFLLSNHYRSPVDFSPQNMVEARANLERFYSALQGVEEFLAGKKETIPLTPKTLRGVANEVWEKISAVKDKFLEAMEDDFNTALALGYLHDLARVLNRVLADKGFRKDPAAAALLSEGGNRLRESGVSLGLFQQAPAEYFNSQRARFLQAKGMQEKEIKDLIGRREEARKAKDWTRADEIRAQAASLGIVLEDGPSGTTWRPA